MASLCKLEDIPTHFASYIEELHEFFNRRGALYGSPDRIEPFIERLAADAVFRDEMSSMVRAIIYRVRDGLSRLELMELILVAVGGNNVGDASEELHEPVRRMLAFVDTVFKSRWNAMKDIADEKEKTAGAEETAKPVEASQAARSDTPAIDGSNGPARTQGATPAFGAVPAPDMSAPNGDAPSIGVATMRAAAAMGGSYRAEPAVAQDAVHDAPVHAQPGPPDVIHQPLLLRGQRPRPAREWHTRGEERILPEAPRGSEVSLEAVIAEEGSSRRWFWTAGFCALVMAFCVGLFFVERAADMPLEIENGQMATAPPQPIASDLGTAHGAEKPPAAASAAQAASCGPTGTAHPEQTNERPVSGATSSGRPRQWRSVGQVRYSPTALFGVSPGMMRGHLLYAPEPEYPRMARLAHIEGQVAVEAVVTREGSVAQANILSGHRLLRNAALRAVRERRYRPYLVNGRPTDVATILTVDFRLKE